MNFPESETPFNKPVSFTKMHGIGNDFILMNHLNQNFSTEQLSLLAKHLCHRKFGVGSDGLILVEPGNRTPYKMRMFNPDGSESEACGNGTRCFARYLLEKGLTEDSLFSIETKQKPLEIKIEANAHVTVNMGKPAFTRKEIGISGDPNVKFFEETIEIEGTPYKGTAISMGNPHLVFFAEELDLIPLEKWGPFLENHTLFPNRINIHFVQIMDNQTLVQRTWERGAGITLACGSGACAAAVAAHHTKSTHRHVQVQLPGGHLSINYQEDENVWMTGPAEAVFEGVWKGTLKELLNDK